MQSCDRDGRDHDLNEVLYITHMHTNIQRAEVCLLCAKDEHESLTIEGFSYSHAEYLIKHSL